MDTFTARDFVGLVTFNDAAETADANLMEDDSGLRIPVLSAMTDGTLCTDPDRSPSGLPEGCNNKMGIIKKIDEMLNPPSGGTDYYEGFKYAFDMLTNSQRQMRTSECSRMILFLTDGLDRSGRQDLLGDIQTMQNNQAIPIFTYTFGDEVASARPEQAALAQLPQKIACQNGGIAYNIPDGGDLLSVMTDYYTYFANQVDVDQIEPAAIKARWIKYTDGSGTGAKLMAGCKPIYDATMRSAGDVVLMGVVCMDMNIFETVEGLEGRDEYKVFEASMERQSNACMQITPTDSVLQSLRVHPNALVCRACDMEAAACGGAPEESIAGRVLVAALAALAIF